MFVPIDNTPRDYAWGSRGEISRLRGRPWTDAVEAELWLGTHPGCPAHLADGTGRDLPAWIHAYASDEIHPLPFLMKVLAAGSPLSLQAHPDEEQARRGWAREDEAGISRDADERVYRDDQAKPEMILALEDGFEALCGLREAHDVLGDLTALTDPRVEPFLTALGEGTEEAVRWALTAPTPVVAAAAACLRENLRELGEETRGTVAIVTAAHPDDPTLTVAVMLHRVVLRRGEALFLPARMIHGYLHGIGIEIMRASDNVLRAGLTSKHVAVDELLTVADLTPARPETVRPQSVDGAEVYAPDTPDFQIVNVQSGSRACIGLHGPAVAIALGGGAQVRGSEGDCDLGPGDALFVTGDEKRLEVAGEGLFVLGQAGVATP